MLPGKTQRNRIPRNTVRIDGSVKASPLKPTVSVGKDLVR